jgi:hypothetical protein
MTSTLLQISSWRARPGLAGRCGGLRSGPVLAQGDWPQHPITW